MLLYYITDRTQFPGPEPERRRRLLERIAAAARAGVDYIQLREKDLSARELAFLAREAVALLAREAVALLSKLETRNSKLLINHRTDIALATGADGVHLRSDDIPASDARTIAASSAARNSRLGTRNFLVAVSCHTAAEVGLAESHGADFAVFAPVFEKAGAAGVGLAALRAACRPPARRDRKVEGEPRTAIPVLALGGVTVENAAACLAAGAAGVAGIRLFQEGDVEGTVRLLRSLNSQVSHARVAQPRSGDTSQDFPTNYRRRLPDLQRGFKPLFVTFRAWGNLKIPEEFRDAVLAHCLHDNGRMLDMYAVVVMPEHVHMLFSPLPDTLGQPYTAVEILSRIKGASAHTLNKALGRSGPVWQDESFDHVLRSAESLEAKIRYIRENPVRRRLAKTPEEYRWLWTKI